MKKKTKKKPTKTYAPIQLVIKPRLPKHSYCVRLDPAILTQLKRVSAKTGKPQSRLVEAALLATLHLFKR